MPVDEHVDESYTYAIDILTLENSQIIPNVSIPLDHDAPFYARMLVADGRNEDLEAYTNFSIQLRDANGRYMSNIPIRWNNYQGLGPMPYVYSPELPFPLGGEISFDIYENAGSGGPYSVQLGNHGVKRYARDCNPGCGPVPQSPV